MYLNGNQMKTQIKKIGNRLFIEIPDSIEKLYQLKMTDKLSMWAVEKNNSLIINGVLLNSNNDFKIISWDNTHVKNNWKINPSFKN